MGELMNTLEIPRTSGHPGMSKSWEERYPLPNKDSRDKKDRRSGDTAAEGEGVCRSG